jgi:hypothetical protein
LVSSVGYSHWFTAKTRVCHVLPNGLPNDPNALFCNANCLFEMIKTLNEVGESKSDNNNELEK